jgi:glycosyltransferase involved in cell wall biosynthesis
MNSSIPTPFFSVCIPTYNTANYIGEAIQSILDQTFTDYEIVISDNCSTDNTKEVVDSFNSDKIKYFLNPENIGLYPNMTLTCQRARGKYLQVLCADDKFSPFCLEVIYQQLALRGFSHGAVAIGYDMEESALLNEKPTDSFNYKISSINSDQFFDYINQKIDTNLGGLLSTICATKAVFAEIGYFGNDVKSINSDVYTWLKLVLSTNCLLIDRPILCYYRRHQNQVGVIMKNVTTISECFDFFETNKQALALLDRDGRNTEIFLNDRIAGQVANGISKGIELKNFSYLAESLKIIKQYGYRVPFFLVFKIYLLKIGKLIQKRLS